MTAVTVTRLVHASPSAVWDIISNVVTVANWHPAVESADLLSASPTGLGATRRCNFYDGTSVVEKVTEVEPGKRVHLVLSEFSLPMTRFEAEIVLSPADGGHTQATFILDYDMKYGVLGKAMSALIVQGQMSKLMNRVIGGLDHHVLTGEVVAADFTVAA